MIALLLIGDTYVDETITSGLGSDQASTPGSALASEHAFPFVPLRTIGTKEPSNFATRHANVTGWHISICTNMPAELAHESNAELPDFIVGFALGVEICTALAATNVDWYD